MKFDIRILMFFCHFFWSYYAYCAEPEVDLDKLKKESKNIRNHFRLNTPYGETKVTVFYPPDQVHFYSTLKSIMENEGVKVVNWLKHAPSEVFFIMNQRSPTANGSAQVFPRNYINLNLYPIEDWGSLSANHDWFQLLVVHEWTHVVHLDMTDGIPHVWRSIFGATGKWGGIVPRWFSEGLAIYAESKLTPTGRLKSKRIYHEMVNALAYVCDNISCLNTPRTYPYGGLPYYAGSFFLADIEEQKAGALSCIVRENADNIPFFLNDAFEDCTGSNAEQLFSEFRKRLLAKHKISDENLKNDIFKPSFYPVIVDGEHAFYLQIKKNRYQLIHYHQGKEVSSYPIDTYPYGLFHGRPGHSVVLKHKNPSAMMKMQFTEYFISPKNEPKKIKFAHTCDTPLFTEQGYFCLNYSLSHFHLFKNTESKNEFLHYAFPENVELQYSKTVEINQKWYMVALKNEITPKISKSKLIVIELLSDLPRLDYLEFDLFDDMMELSGANRWQLFYTPKGLATSYMVGIDISELISAPEQQVKMVRYQLPNDLLQLHFSALQVLGLSSGKSRQLGPLADSTQQYLATLPKQVQTINTNLERKKGISWNQEILRQREQSAASEEQNARSIISPGDMVPNFWVLNYAGTQDLHIFSATTMITDPQQKIIFPLNLNYQDPIGKLSGGGDLVWRTGWYLSPSIGYQFRYEQPSYGSRIFETERSYFSLSSRFPLKAVTVIPKTTVMKERVSDDLSSRKVNLFGGSLEFSYTPTFSQNPVLSQGLAVSYFRHEVENAGGFNSYQGKLISNFTIAPYLRWYNRAAAGYLDKKDFFRGIISGGSNSVSLFGEQGSYDFYGANPRDFYGNTLITARTQGEWRIAESYHGNGLFPLYTKTWNVLTGMEWLKTDIYYSGQYFYRDVSIPAVHAGIRWDGVLGYGADLTADIVLSYLLDSDVVDSDRYLLGFNISGRLF